LEFFPSLRKKHAGVVRLLSFINHANMSSYREVISAFLDGQDPAPDITVHRRQGRVKYGFGLNAEQELTRDLRAFGRLGGTMGARTSLAYTEVDRTALFAVDYRFWKRSKDKVGAALVINGISGDHRRYLAWRFVRIRCTANLESRL
jgi:high affinity Mn2+ porin